MRLSLRFAVCATDTLHRPNIGSFIHEQNKKLRPQTVPASHHIPLASLIIGNGLTEPYTQFASIPDFACAPSDTAIFDDATCRNIRQKVPTCQRLQKVRWSPL